MISENISHDSKVSTIEYDMDGQIEEDEYGEPHMRLATFPWSTQACACVCWQVVVKAEPEPRRR